MRAEGSGHPGECGTGPGRGGDVAGRGANRRLVMSTQDVLPATGRPVHAASAAPAGATPPAAGSPAAAEGAATATAAEAHEESPAPSRRRVRRGQSARTQILISYVVLLAASAVLSTLVIREILLIRLDDRVASALEQEILELDRLIEDGRDPQTGTRFTSLESLFDVYLARNVPSDEEGMLAFAGGRLYRSTLERFPLGSLPDDLVARFAALSSEPRAAAEDLQGEFETRLGRAYYRASPIRFREGGLFVVTILPAAELRNIDQLRAYGFLATLAVLFLASGVAWLVAGRVLAPVRLLTQTAHSISTSDLTRRVEAYGGGEAAEMARSFNSMLDRLEGLFRDQREFVRDTSHELRDPLTICRGHLELLGDDPVERRETVALVLDELDRMARIVDDLQLLAEAEQPDFLWQEAVELRPFAHELLAKASALGDRRWALDPSVDGEVVADRHRLTEAVMNLAHNAVKHTEPGDVVAVGAAVADGEARVWVRDTGTGIVPGDRERIFERFVRGKGAVDRYRGGGLGLAIVRLIARAHGGRVELETEVGEGSTFTIVLPHARPGGGDGGADPDR
jgi:two-component system, OmpR family, sensor kinase